MQPVRLPAAGRVSRPGTSTLVEVTSIGVRQGAPKWRLIVSGTRLRIGRPPRCWAAGKVTARTTSGTEPRYCTEITTFDCVGTPFTLAASVTSPVPRPAGSIKLIW